MDGSAGDVRIEYLINFLLSLDSIEAGEHLTYSKHLKFVALALHLYFAAGQLRFEQLLDLI